MYKFGFSGKDCLWLQNKLIWVYWVLVEARKEKELRERYYKTDGKGKNIQAQKVHENEERNTVFEGNTVCMKLSELLCTLSYLKIVSGFESIDFFFFNCSFSFLVLFPYIYLTQSQRLVLKLHVQICIPKYKFSSPNIPTQFLCQLYRSSSVKKSTWE